MAAGALSFEIPVTHPDVDGSIVEVAGIFGLGGLE